MTTAQEVLTNAFPPFPFFVENPVEPDRADLPANNNHHSNDSSGYVDTNPLPERCQFTFSDGRQCTMPRSDIHPCLCPYHSERERQLFGEPGPGGAIVGAALDLPELHSACRDLTTPNGVGRALGQVMRLLAQRRISQKEAATFGYLAQLLLKALSATRAESAGPACSDFLPPVEHGHDLVVERQKGVPITPLLAHQKVAQVAHQGEAQVNLALPPEAPPLIVSGDTGQLAPTPARTERRIGLGTPHNHHSPVADHNSLKINTSEFVELETPQNQHLHKNGGGGNSLGTA